MKPAVRIERGYYLIDTDAWVVQRVGDRQHELTDQLRDYLHHDVFRHQHTPIDASGKVLLWCAARQCPVGGAAPIHHDDDRLTRPVTVILATTTPPGEALAIVLVDGQAPVVYPDRTTDEGYWHQVATVDICCPSRHGWTWDGARTLLRDGHETTLRAVFGPDPNAPFERCHACAAYDRDETDQLCACSGTAIYCPVCAARCELTLPAVPTYDQP